MSLPRLPALKDYKLSVRQNKFSPPQYALGQCVYPSNSKQTRTICHLFIFGCNITLWSPPFLQPLASNCQLWAKVKATISFVCYILSQTLTHRITEKIRHVMESNPTGSLRVQMPILYRNTNSWEVNFQYFPWFSCNIGLSPRSIYDLYFYILSGSKMSENRHWIWRISSESVS